MRLKFSMKFSMSAMMFNSVFGLVLSALMSTCATAGDFRLPAFEVTQLSNGLTLYLMERHDVPLVNVRAVLKVGAVSDGAQAGLAGLSADALLLGTSSHDKKTIDQSFDFRGARLSSGAGLEASSLNLDMASKDSAEFLPLFAEVLLHPSFDAVEFAKLRARSVDGLKQAKESPRNVLTNYYRSMLFASGSYANATEGSVASVGNLQRSDVEHFYQSFYRPENTALIVVGDFKSSEMRSQLESLFGAWKINSTLPNAQATGKVVAEKARVWLVNKADAGETTFVFGGAGIARSDPDFVALKVINTILGGRFTSWLNDELRINSGLTYGANSYFTTFSNAGSFAVSSFTATAKTEATLALATKTYQRLWDKGIDAKTLASAKAYVKGQYPPNFETNQQLAGLLGDMFISKVGREQIDNFMSEVDSLTPEKAKRLVDKHFPRDKLQMVLIGKAEAIRDIAKKYGEVTELEITADGYGSTVK
ncbi:MAG: insulinase family protein [Undibacterium sp.]|nr:insulinase family protein [Undibacterium sp.]